MLMSIRSCAAEADADASVSARAAMKDFSFTRSGLVFGGLDRDGSGGGTPAAAGTFRIHPAPPPKDRRGPRLRQAPECVPSRSRPQRLARSKPPRADGI